MKEFKKVKKHLNVYIVTKYFARKNIMKKHERTHTDEKNLIYVCNAFWGHLEVCKVLLEIKVTKIFIKIMDLLHFI